MTTNNTQDIMTVQFGGGLSPIPNGPAISDWTSYSIERDFMTAADHFHLTMEDDRATQLNQQLQIGQQLKFFINNNLIMIGYIDDYHMNLTPGGGTQLTITGRDLLGQAAQAYILPNMGTNLQTNFIFPATTTYLQAFQLIFGNFQASVPLAIVNDDNAMLTLSTGGRIGPKSHGKTIKGQSRSLSSSLSHIYKPDVHETYLTYAKRLAATLGCYIKVVIGTDGQELILISPPTYDRSNTQFYQLYHSAQTPTANNVLDLHWNISYKEQASVMIGQCTYGQPGYRKQTQKCVRINEITGYQLPVTGNLVDQSNLLLQSPLNQAIPNVSATVKALTTVQNDQNPGYYLMPSNTGLRAALQNLPIQVNTQFSRPEYYESNNAHTKVELEFDIAFEMSKKQNEFLTVEYEVENHTGTNGSDLITWQPNLLCNVHEDILSTTGAPFDATLWIQKVTFQRTVDHGPITKLQLRLPYVYTADITT